MAHDARAWTVLFILVLTAAISRQSCGVSYPDFRPGDIARYDILAPFDLEMPDEETTEVRRQAERERVLPVYDYDPQVAAEVRVRFRNAFDRARGRYQETITGPEGEPRRPTELEIEAIRGEWTPMASVEAYRALARRDFDANLGTELETILAAVLKRRTVINKALLPSDRGISVRDRQTGEEFILDRLETILDLDQARAQLRSMLRDREGVRAADVDAVASLLESVLPTNLTYNAGETERRRELAARNIPLLVTKIPKAKIIVRKGEEVTPEVLAQLAFIEERSGSEVEILSVFGSFLLLLMLVFFIWRYATYHQRFYTRVRELYLLLLMVTLSVLLFSKVVVLLADRFTETVYSEPFNQATSYYYAIPLGACAMLITLLTNARIAMVASVFFSVLFGMLVDWEASLMVYALVSNFAAIFGITQYQERTALLRAGTAVGAINLITIFALDCIYGTLTPASRVGLDLACGFAGGILIAVLVSFFLPLLEGFFNVLTDVRLLELSNLNNPLLRQLSIQAPGSYNHSVMVGTLAEAAADAIQANSLFCRVAAYYHDIGKMNHPEYFIENMQDGVYRHEGLSPSLSVLVIQNHVKEGIEMAVKEGLPQPIIDVIPQHHGTRLIRYFYEKAKQEAKPGQEVKKEDFRYPGPKPQSKETAIFMMADSVEAAARTVEDPSPARFKVVIRKIFNDIVLDGQLDECDLTFADLDKIGEAFLKRLLSIYHQRIDYPGFDFRAQPQRAPSGEEVRHEKVAPIRGKGWR
jgi:putative nucleotidyltransferase with HDIG domain